MMLLKNLQAFFFSRQTATGFGLMRIAWAFVAFIFLLMQWQDVSLFYSHDGLMDSATSQILLRHRDIFSLLFFVTSPSAVFALYVLLLFCLLATMIGIFPRFMTIVSLLLLFSFHEQNPDVLGGGDTVLRNIGFILAISPVIDALSWKRLLKQHEQMEKTGSSLPPLTMPAWPYRLLLWQMIIMYGTSFWYKLLGHMWLAGTAVAIPLHHPVFARWSVGFMNAITPLSTLVDWTSLAWEGLWVFLLVPRWLTNLLPPQLPRIPLKRCLIIGGIFFHGSIFILLDAGSFSLAMFAAYCGLLQDDDIAWIERVIPGLRNFGMRMMRVSLRKDKSAAA